MQNTERTVEDRHFSEFRRRVKDADILSPDIKKLMGHLAFSGRLSVVVQNGRILKSGYEEGYFTRRQQERMIP